MHERENEYYFRFKIICNLSQQVEGVGCVKYRHNNNKWHTGNMKKNYKKNKRDERQFLPPSFWASLITWRASVVFPEASFPKISTILPYTINITPF